MTYLRLQDVHKSYGRRNVLKAATIVIEEPQHLVVRGGNGSGKSTLLRVMAGAAQPTRGTVERHDGTVAYLPEKFTPPPLMPCRTYLVEMGRLQGLGRGEAKKRSDQLCERLQLQPGSASLPPSLSQGNLQKVGLVQSFAAASSVIILDEPRTGLDGATKSVLDQLISEAVSAGSLVISSEHADINVWAPVSSCVEIRDGRIRQLTPPTSMPVEELCTLVLRFGRTHDQPDPNLLGLRDHRIVDDRDGFRLTGQVPLQAREATIMRAINDGWQVLGVSSESEPTRSARPRTGDVSGGPQ